MTHTRICPLLPEGVVREREKEREREREREKESVCASERDRLHTLNDTYMNMPATA